MSPARLRGSLSGATALLGALVFLAWSQPWFTVALTAASGDPAPLEVRGDVAAPALVPLALTLLAIVAALALAGPVFRIVFGILEALIGVCVVVASVVALGDPVAASSRAITDRTGITGDDSVAALVTSVEVSAWPTIAIALGAVGVALGLLVALTAPRWPASGRRYTRTRTAPADGGAPDAVAEWDALSDGDDPTVTAR